MSEQNNISSNNKRIAKNTILLYIRMAITIVISLYTSRVVLQTLGVEDYGIYGLVGGIVIMLTFLNASMSGATSRFITFAIGEHNTQKIKDTFCTAFIIHVLIAFIIFVLAETIGFWFVYNKLVIPESRHFAAMIVYHLCILATMATVIQTPFNASIIAYERMDAFAYIEIANTCLKLLIVFLLPILPFDKLISYGALFLIINLCVLLMYVTYCRMNFDVCKVYKLKDRSHFSPMLRYCLWDLFGNLSGTLKQQGTNIIINLFFGVMLNAASAIATQVQSAVTGLAGNVIQAFRPQIIKNYAKGNIELMETQVCNAIKYTLILYSIVILPLFLEMDIVLKLWLGIVPEYAAIFCRLLLLNSVFGLVSMIIITTNHATGKIKYLSIMTGFFHISVLPVMYVCFKYISRQPEMAYYVYLLFSLFVLTMNLIITKKLIPNINIRRILRNMLIPLLVAGISFLPMYYIYYEMNGSFTRVSLISLLSIIVHVLITYFFVIDKNVRHRVNVLLISKIYNK